MFIVRIKYEGKSRKLSEPINTVEELRKRIGELFGPQAASLHILYKDCDSELVSIVDTEDLTNCYEEAGDLGQAIVTLLVQARIKGSRSSSSKKSVSSSSYSSISFDTDEEEETKALAENQSILDQADAAKKQLKDEYEAKLAAVSAKAQLAREVVSVEKQKEQSRSKSGKRCGERRGPCGDKGSPFKFMRVLGFMKKYAENKGQPNPFDSIRGVDDQIKEKCTGLLITPLLFKEVMSRSLPQIMKTLEESYQQALIANPALKHEIEEAKAEMLKMRETDQWGRRSPWGGPNEEQGHDGRRRFGCHGQRRRDNDNPHSTQQAQNVAAMTHVEVPKQATIEEKKTVASPIFSIPVDKKSMTKEERQKIKAEKEKAKAEKEKAKAEKEAAKKRKEQEKEQAKLQKETEKQKHQLEKETKKNHMKETANKLKHAFPRMNKDEIKTFVKENNDLLNYDQLKQHIQNYRVAKSTTM